MSTIMALKMRRKCPHCGEDLLVLFKRDMTKEGAPLMGAVVHGLLESLDLRIDWQPIGGFEDMARLQEGPPPWEVHTDG